LADRRARWFSLAITGALVGVVLLWSYRNQKLYGRFIFSQVTDFNMAFFNYPALLARETGENEFALRDFDQEVSAKGITCDEQDKPSGHPVCLCAGPGDGARVEGQNNCGAQEG